MNPETDPDALADRLEDMTMSSSRVSGGGGRRGGGKGKGGRGGRGGGGGEGGRARREVDLSRALSRLLRHQAGNAGVELDREGFADLGRVVSSFFFFFFSFLWSVPLFLGGVEVGGLV